MNLLFLLLIDVSFCIKWTELLKYVLEVIDLVMVNQKLCTPLITKMSDICTTI
jgi:hypothetical protein